MGKIRTLTTEQKLAAAPEELFQFLRNPRNLEKIMPKSMGLKIDWDPNNLLKPGDEFVTRLRKNGIPLSWRTRVVEMNEDERWFRDIQLDGPFALWDHTHRVEAFAGGSSVADKLLVKAPLGPLGDLAWSLFLQRDLQQTFDYRLARMYELFGRLQA